jgi:hypothetical protein
MNKKLELAIYLTRGDGGQNLIEPITELLGVIRTQELIEARKKLMEGIFLSCKRFWFSKTQQRH